jgi:formylglycine-generating enzyme required for sulfatase activity
MFVFACFVGLSVAVCGQIPEGNTYTNSLGMEFVRIESGTFSMGYDGAELPKDVTDKSWLAFGDADERPVHDVTVSRPFYMGVVEVTNEQYEAFDPDHKALRGKLKFSTDDDEAVVFVSWHDAVAFCEWLSKKEGLPYRLPTEAEWEYACRAGTTTLFSMGDALPAEYLQNPGQSWYPDPVRAADSPLVPLHVGKTSPNAWGLHDMHGNVEEWCLDWYGPYTSGPQTDPVGLADGDFRVARGGSHSTEPYYLRTANRAATLPEDRTWVIGFRVVIGEMPKTAPLPVPSPARWQVDVRDNRPAEYGSRMDPDRPYFSGPQEYVKVPDDVMGPIFANHNHCPALVECPNGDLLAIWYSCVEERGRELCIVASRLRYGQKEWDEAEMFWDAPDRNDHASALWFDGDQTLYHFNGLSVTATWGSLATIMRTSTDNGATWSKARIIVPDHGPRHMPIESVFRTAEGAILLPCDAATGGDGGSAIHLSYDKGETWTDPGGTIAGIHAGVVQLQDGRLMAFGRGDTINERMPKSISTNMGKTWSVEPSPFPPIGGGQRLVLTRLQEGSLFFASFAIEVPFTDATGTERVGTGLFGALSFDDGETWPVRRLITDNGAGRQVAAMDGNLFLMDSDHAEPRGYMSVCQGADGTIHLISSRQHYQFNLAWLKTPAEAAVRALTVVGRD